MKSVSAHSRYVRIALLLVIVVVTKTAFAGLTGAPTPNTDGNYTVSWTSIAYMDEYKLFESTDGGTNWNQVYIGSALSKSFSGVAAGTYDYDLESCWWDYTFGPIYTCIPSGFGTVEIVVQGGPTIPQNLTGHDFDFDGTYTISWDAATGADDYELQQRIGTAAWPDPQGQNPFEYEGTGTSTSITTTSSDTHQYRVRGCDVNGCSAWSATHTTSVDIFDNIANEESFDSTTVAGSTPFSASVDRLGNSRVNIPLRLPPGVNGLQPSLSLSYSSGGAPALAEDKRSEGTLGYGWSLSGVSKIRRCRTGVGGSINYTTSDLLCLDGKPLTRVSTVGYWHIDAEYRTASQSMLKIETKGTGMTTDGYFEVYTPDGKTLTYGSTDESVLIADSNSLKRYEWALTKIVDEYGNIMTYTWDESEVLGTNILTEIEYDGTKVVFNYQERCWSTTECDTELVQQGENVPGVQYRGVVMNRIRTKVGTNWVNDYRFDNNYTSGYLRLDGVQNCGYNEGGTSSTCMAPLEFTWNILSIVDNTETKDLNVVEKVTNGYGDNTEFNYSVIAGDDTSNHSLHVAAPTWFGTYTEPANLTKNVDLERAVVNWMSEPNGRGGDTLTYHSYNGYPLYSTKGHGYVGFPSIRSKFLSRKVFDASSGTSYDATVRMDRQHRLDFPFIGKTARLIRSVDTDSSTSETWREPERYEFGWVYKGLYSGTVYFVHLARSYSRIHELDAVGNQQTLSGIETKNIYCFRDLVAGDCPTTGTENEYPTRHTATTRIGDGLGSQDFGAVWGVVGDRTVSNQVRIEETTADFENDETGSNWLIGFVSDLTRGHGISGVTLTEKTAFAKDVSSRLSIGAITRFPSDTNHELTTSFDYSTKGNLTTVTTSGINVTSRTTSASLFQNDRYPQTISNALLQNTTLAYDVRFGVPKTVTDPNNRDVDTIYDNFGRVSSVVQPDGTDVSYGYDDCTTGCSMITWAAPRFKVTQSFDNGITQVAPTRISYYGAAGNLVLTEEEAFVSADGYIRREGHYDDVGQLTKTSLPYFSIGGTAKYVEHHYDFKGRSAKRKMPDLSSIDTSYVGSTGVVTVEVEESLTGNTKQSKFNELQLLTETTDGVGTIEAVKTEYTYTVRNNLDTVKVDGAEVADVDYYASGMRSQIDEPNSGITAYLHDALGQLLQVTDGESNKTRYTFDKLGRLSQRIDGYLSGNSETNTWTRDSATYGKGLLQKRENTGFIQTYTYTPSGQLDKITSDISVTGFSDNSNYIIDYGYDGAGRVSTIAYPNITATHEYTSRGHLSKVKDGTTLLHEFKDIDAFGHVAEEAFNNGLKTLRQYDAETGRVTSIETGTTATPKSIQDLLYVWRTNGSLLKRTDEKGTTPTSDDYTDTFAYDYLNKLDKSTTSYWNRILDNTIDDIGNLESKVSNISGDLDITSYNYAVTGKPYRLSSVTIGSVSNTLSYSSNGSITEYDAASGDDTYIGYNSRNRVEKITVGDSATDNTPTARDEFWHGPDGQRYLRRATWMDGSTLETRWTMYLLGGVFEEVHPEHDSSVDYVQRVQLSDSVQHRYTKYPVSSADSINYIHRDHLGSIDVITDASGAIYRNLSFDPFGGRRESNWASDASSTTVGSVLADADSVTGRGFTGHEHLNRTGFIHMNGRVFDPRIGRFLRADPIVQSPTFSQSFNRYAYVTNTPLSFVDPSGFHPECTSSGDDEESVDEVCTHVHRSARNRLNDSHTGGGLGAFFPGLGPAMAGIGSSSGGAGSSVGSGLSTSGADDVIDEIVVTATRPTGNSWWDMMNGRHTWNGTYNISGLGALRVGGTKVTFTLTSECVEGDQWTVEIEAKMKGFETRHSLNFSAAHSTSVTFYDPFRLPSPTNLVSTPNNSVQMAGGNFVSPMGGGSVTFFRLGYTWGHSIGLEFGLDFGGEIKYGTAEITNEQFLLNCAAREQ